MDRYYFKNFTYVVRRYNDPAMTISATLMCGERVVATLEGANLPKRGVRVVGDRRLPSIEITGADPDAWAALTATLTRWTPRDPNGTPYPADDRLFLLIVTLAQSAYYHRRAQQLSLKHTVYRLHGDPDGEFRLINQRPLTPEIEQGLIEMHGAHLAWIYRSDRRGPGRHLFAPAYANRTEVDDQDAGLPRTLKSATPQQYAPHDGAKAVSP